MKIKILTPEEMSEGLINSLEEVHKFLKGFAHEDSKIPERREVMISFWKRESKILNYLNRKDFHKK
jgi:hypothetical protein